MRPAWNGHAALRAGGASVRRTTRTMPAQAGPHIATQCGPPASPITNAAPTSVSSTAGSEDARELRAVAVRLQMAVEHHGDGTHHIPAGRRDLDALVVDAHQAQGFVVAQQLELRREVLA